MNSVKRIPAEFLEVETHRVVWQSVKVFMLWLVPGLLSFTLVQLNAGFWFAVPFLALLGGHGLQCISLLGHEGTHFSLHADRWRSAVWGTWLSSFTPFHLNTGFAVNHSEHHAFTNTEKDPDYIFFRKINGFWRRLFWARLATSKRSAQLTWILALKRWPEGQLMRVGLSVAQMTKLARLNLILSYSLLAIYIALTVRAPGLMVCVLWLPLAMATLISGLRPYVEHVGTDRERGNDSRSWISPTFDALYGSINYHQAHHLWPKVPSYKLKKLHHLLLAKEGGISSAAPEVRSVREFLRIASKPM